MAATTTATTPALHLVHGSAYDSILLTDRSGRVVSEWRAGAEEMEDLVESGRDTAAWPVRDTDGLTVDDRAARLGDWGTPVLSVSGDGWQIHDEALAQDREQLHGVAFPRPLVLVPGVPVAEQISQRLGEEGQVWKDRYGVELDQLCRDAGAVLSYARSQWDEDAREYQPVEVYRTDPWTLVRYGFSDGSAIVAAEGGWDIEGETPFSWAGAQN